jgi:hypothetical protein
MTGINTTLIANNYICGATQQIGDFAFTFITPLSAYDYNICQGRKFGSKPIYFRRNKICR